MIKYITCLMMVISFAVQAQPTASNSEPISIEAGQQLEWLRDQNLYRATSDVVITQGDIVIRGDKAEARYDAAQGPSALTQIDIDGHVVITQGDRKIEADHGIYFADTQVVELTGQRVTITTPQAKVMANDKIIYAMAERKAVASGGATIIQPEQTLKAATITAWFAEKDNALQRAVAVGNVTITRSTKEGKDVVQADRGDYNAQTNQVVLTGNVRLTRDDNFMQGSRATVDLKTGYSALQNNPTTGGRVRAVFTTDGKSPVSSNAVTAPMVPAKQNPEQPYQFTR
jgi:lipopolysaccharide export system protein LptA